MGNFNLLIYYKIYIIDGYLLNISHKLAIYDANPSDENRANMAKATADVEGWKEGGDYRAGLHAAGGAMIAGLGGGNAIAGAVGAGASSLAAGKLAELGSAVSGSVGSGNANLDEAIGNLAANIVAGGIGAAVGGGSGAPTAANVDRFNRQLHADERKWAKDSAKEFAEFYAEKTGRELTDEQAQRMLLATGYRLVDDMASKGVAGDKYAVAFISANAGSLFSSTPEERRDPGPLGGSLTPEQKAMPAHPNPQLGMAAGAGLGLVAVGTVAPVFATGWALGTAYDYASDTLNYSSGLSKDAPSVGKSLGVGGITGALAPMALPMTHFGRGVVSKIVAGTYNAGLSGTAAFGSSAIFSPPQNPGLAGTLAGGATAMGTGFKSLVPGPAGIFMNQIIQVAPGSLQKAIENQKEAKK